MTVEKMIEVIERIKEDANRLDVGIDMGELTWEDLEEQALKAHMRELTWEDLEEQALKALYTGGYFYSNLYNHVYNKMDELEYFSNGVFLDALDDVLDALNNVIA